MATNEDVMNSLIELSIQLDAEALTCRAVIETPKCRQFKFDYALESGLFELAGVLPTGMSFPLAFGLIPSTIAEDSDPMDVLVLAEEDLPVGCLLTLRLLGLIEAAQTEGGNTVRDDRIIGKVAQSRLFADVTEVGDLGEAFTGELGRFFVAYNALKDQRFEITSVDGAKRAARRV
jgi:Inorganic pyrophosphatase